MSKKHESQGVFYLCNSGSVKNKYELSWSNVRTPWTRIEREFTSNRGRISIVANRKRRVTSALWEVVDLAQLEYLGLLIYIIQSIGHVYT